MTDNQRSKNSLIKARLRVLGELDELIEGVKPFDQAYLVFLMTKSLEIDQKVIKSKWRDEIFNQTCV